jgi:hypothetical protein
MRLTMSVILGLAVAGASCGDSTMGPSATGRVEAVIEDSSTSGVTGTIAGNISASIWDGDRWVDLGSPNGITVLLQGGSRTTTIHGEQSVAPVEYSRTRITFQGVTARLASGSVVSGTTLVSDANVVLGGADQRAEITAPISITIDANTLVRHTVIFDLRSQLWLTLGAVQAGRVEDAPLQAAITASARVDPR